MDILLIILYNIRFVNRNVICYKLLYKTKYVILNIWKLNEMSFIGLIVNNISNNFNDTIDISCITDNDIDSHNSNLTV